MALKLYRNKVLININMLPLFESWKVVNVKIVGCINVGIDYPWIDCVSWVGNSKQIKVLISLARIEKFTIFYFCH